MKNKKIVPKLRFPEFRAIEEWQSKKLIDICEKVTQGGTPDTTVSDYWNGEIEWLTPAEMGKCEVRFTYSTARKITKEGLKNCSSELLPCDSVIISTRAPIGHLTINKNKMAINQGCKGLVPNLLNYSDFLYYSLWRNKEKLKDLGAGNTFKELSSSSLKNFEICVPTLIEQKKIADCLSSLDDLITAHTKKLYHLKTHKKGLMQQLFPAEGETVPKLRFPEFRGAEEWESTTLGKIASLHKGKGISKAEIDDTGKSFCIRYGELYTKYKEAIFTVYSKTNTPTNELVLSKKNDVLIPSSGETKIDIATASCVMQDGIAIGGDINVIRSNQNGVFLSYYLNSAKKLDIAKLAQGDAVVHLYISQLELLNVVIPTLIEQQKIADCLSSLDDLITAQTQKIEALKLHKKGLMQQLFPTADEVDSE